MSLAIAWLNVSGENRSGWLNVLGDPQARQRRAKEPRRRREGYVSPT
jgi:hypothetical protein